MMTILISVALFALAMVGMAMGVILSDRKLKGSCGGSGEDCVCEIEKRRACHARKKMMADYKDARGVVSLQSGES